MTLAGWAAPAAAQAPHLLGGVAPAPGRAGILDPLLAPVASALRPVGGALGLLRPVLAPVGAALQPLAPVTAPVAGLVDRVVATPGLSQTVGTVKPLVDPLVSPLLPTPVLTTATTPAAGGSGLSLVDAAGATLGGLTGAVQPVVDSASAGLQSVLAPASDGVLAPVTRELGAVAAPVVLSLHARLAATESLLPGVEAFAAGPPAAPLRVVDRADDGVDLVGGGVGQVGRPLAAPSPTAPADTAAPTSREALAEAVRRGGARIELLPDGPAVRGQVLAVSPSAATLSSLRKRGFSVLSRERLAADGQELVVLAAPPGRGLDTALRVAARLDPNGLYAPNHLYALAGSVRGARGPAAAPTALGRAARPIVVGLLDQAVDPASASLRGVTIRQARFATGATAGAHGLAVASLLVADGGHTREPSVLYVADVYGPTGAAEALSVVRALAWMARERVPVVNVSLVGPNNPLVAQQVARLIGSGQLVVAAAGNDGPLAAPLYPAALPGVVAVTGVDRRARILPEAARGPHIDFAAPAAGLVPGGAGTMEVRGTSFAAPLVAARLAQRLPTPNPAQAEAAVAGLGRIARDLGAAGRDPVYGDGLVAEDTLAWTRPPANGAGPKRAR